MKIKLVGYLKAMGGFSEKEISLTKKLPLRDLIDFRLPKERVVVLINEKGASFDSLVQNSDEVKILPIVGGG